MLRRRSLLALSLPALLAPGLARAAAAPKGGTSQNTFMAFPTLSATIVRGDGRRGVMTVETGIDAKDGSLRERAEQLAPRLRHAHTNAVRAFAASMLPGAAPDADRLAAELQKATDQTLGRAGAKLLLGTVLVN